MSENKSKKQWTAEDVIAIQNLIKNLNTISLNMLIMPSDGTIDTFTELGDLIEDKGPGPEEIVERNDVKKILASYIKKLTPREQIVINERFGLTDRRPKTLEETGKLFGIGRERVRQIEEKALQKLKRLLNAKGLYNNINDF